MFMADFLTDLEPALIRRTCRRYRRPPTVPLYWRRRAAAGKAEEPDRKPVESNDPRRAAEHLA